MATTIGLRHFSQTSMDWLKRASIDSTITKTSLAKEFCRREQWQNSADRFCIEQAIKILPELWQSLGITPKLKTNNRSESKSSQHRRKEVEFSYTKIGDQSLKSFGEITIDLVKSRSQDSLRWQKMMRDYHPLGIPTHAGKCVKYFIKSEVYGVLGGFSFHAAGWSDKSRDDFIGWSPEARLTQNNIRLLINNSRFLILPGIRVKNLASWVLGRIRLRVSSDWDERYGDRPVYMFTYVNPKTHSGACYKGAGWDKMGETSGRRDQDNVSKLIFGCSLAENACETLCYTSKKSRFDFHHDTYVPEEAPWYEKEFGGSTHPDGRIQKRILKVDRGWCSRPGASFGEKFPERAEHRAVQRVRDFIGFKKFAS